MQVVLRLTSVSDSDPKVISPFSINLFEEGGSRLYIIRRY